MTCLRSCGLSFIALCLFLTFLQSGISYGQCVPPAKRAMLIVADAGSGRDTLFFGHHPAATHGRDTSFCEHELPPPPPSGIFDLRFTNPPGYEGLQPPTGFGQGFYNDYRQQISPTQVDTHRVRLQPSLAGYPMTLSWQIPSLLAMCDSAWLQDEFGGTVAKARMHVASSLVVTNPAITSLLLIKFGTVETPSVPLLSSPVDGAINQAIPVSLAWNSSTQAVRYHVQLATDALFSALVLLDTAVTSTSRSTGALAPNTTYYWRVRATNYAGTSGWSGVRSFSTIALPGTPGLLSPADGATGLNPALQLMWSTGSNASTYNLVVSTDSLFGSSVISTTTADTTLGASGLASGTQFFWRVRAHNGAGDGSWSNARRFATIGPVTHQYPIQAGWNLVSVPLAVNDPRTTTLFSTATSQAFSFETSGYLPADSLNNGAGYWLKFSTTKNIGVTGMPLLQDTITVRQGWNLIGSINASVPVGSIIELPSGLVQSSYYGYNSGYTSVSSLEPGNAYWVKAATAGQLVLLPAFEPSSIQKPAMDNSSK